MTQTRYIQKILPALACTYMQRLLHRECDKDFRSFAATIFPEQSVETYYSPSISTHAGTAPEARRAAAGALFTTNSTSSRQMLIHGGRLEAGHILDDLWHASLGAGNITYQQLWPPQTESLLGKKRKGPGPAARKGHVAVMVEDPDTCLVSLLNTHSSSYSVLTQSAT